VIHQRIDPLAGAGRHRKDLPFLAAPRGQLGCGGELLQEAVAAHPVDLVDHHDGVGRQVLGHEPVAAAHAVAGIATNAPARVLPERESLELLRAAGLPVTEAAFVPDPDAAVATARALGGRPVALKLDAVGLPHKSDLGLVRLGLLGDEQVRSAGDDLLATAHAHGLDARGLLVEPMADAGVELIVGLRRDPSFGPAVVVGLGGMLTEVLDDVAIRLAPLDRETALGMLAGLRGARILDGIRGSSPVDRGAVADLIVALSRLGDTRPDIVEIDLNPVIASANGAIAVDALVVLDPAAAADPERTMDA